MKHEGRPLNKMKATVIIVCITITAGWLSAAISSNETIIPEMATTVAQMQSRPLSGCDREAY